MFLIQYSCLGFIGVCTSYCNFCNPSQVVNQQAYSLFSVANFEAPLHRFNLVAVHTLQVSNYSNQSCVHLSAVNSSFSTLLGVWMRNRFPWIMTFTLRNVSRCFNFLQYNELAVFFQLCCRLGRGVWYLGRQVFTRENK